MEKLKTREEFDKLKINWDLDESYEAIWVKATFKFNPKDIDIVRVSSRRISTKEKVLSMNGKECFVEILALEFGYELEKMREYDIVFKQEHKKPYKLTVFESELVLK